MIIVTVVYPHADGATFDFDYYERTHMPLVEARWGSAGFRGSQALRGVAGVGGGPPPFLAAALLQFESLEHFTAALSGEHASEILGDVANFTSVQPLVQVNSTIWDTRR